MMKKVKEFINKYLTQKVRNIISIVVIVLGTIWFINYSLFRPTYINMWISKVTHNDAYIDAGFDD